MSFDRWTGYVQPAFPEKYVFIVEANDGARLWIDDQLMFDNFDEVRCPFGLLLGTRGGRHTRTCGDFQMHVVLYLVPTLSICL